jgi:hypothetical protein
MQLNSDHLSLLRFPGDVTGAEEDAQFENRRTVFMLNDLLVQPEVVPTIASAVRDVCSRLGIDECVVQAFIYASPHFQAECYTVTAGRCIVRLSSALIEALNESELTYVIGHELGHYLYRHYRSPRQANAKDLEWLLMSRRRELSVDRVGLFSCRSLPSALAAMIKTVSGLTEKHLRLDVASFISQLHKMDRADSVSESDFSTHPAFIIRCRALLWMSMNSAFGDGNPLLDRAQLEETNTRIESDLARYVDKPINDAIAGISDDYRFWSLASAVARKGAFTKTAQAKFISSFGDERTEKLKGLLSTLSPREALAELEQRLLVTTRDFEEVAPTRLADAAKRLRTDMESILFA